MLLEPQSGGSGSSLPESLNLEQVDGNLSPACLECLDQT